ncbi:hypothetical protein FHS57_005149 [Runella defluvii]|uniref:Uncharacterized protein n=1 Tax=Runella defluvii TaxID=370973 RepID=A0A7W5ZPB0_9BACT|nr:hypothetical protein [Runella defluvii]MBB3841128.1 hypothetical protein [Runella defluvii]
MKTAPRWLRFTVATIVIISGAVSLVANYVTIQDYLEKKKTLTSKE